MCLHEAAVSDLRPLSVLTMSEGGDRRDGRRVSLAEGESSFERLALQSALRVTNSAAMEGFPRSQKKMLASERPTDLLPCSLLPARGQHASAPPTIDY
jgi:hypothetical protein